MKRYISLFLTGCIISMGCATMKESDTARTGLEQLLISNAVDQSLAKVDFRPVQGAKVFLKTDLLDCVDKNYILLCTRSKLLENHSTLVDKAEDADIVMEIASGGVGTDRNEMVVGTPEIPLGIMGSVPKVNFYERKKAMGTAAICGSRTGLVGPRIHDCGDSGPGRGISRQSGCA